MPAHAREGESAATAYDTTAAQRVTPDRLVPHPGNPRKVFDDERMAELVASVRRHGVLQPLLVTRMRGQMEGQYTIINGERRWRAAKEAGLKWVPVMVRPMTDDEILDLMLTENLQREDLTPVEEAEGYRAVIDGIGITQAQLAERLGVSQGHVANRLRLLRLPDEVRDDISREILTASHGLALLKICPQGADPSPLLDEAREEIGRYPGRDAGRHLDRILVHEGRTLNPLEGDLQSWDIDGLEWNLKVRTWSMCRWALFSLDDCVGCHYSVEVEGRDGEPTPRCINPPCWEERQVEAVREILKEHKKPEKGDRRAKSEATAGRDDGEARSEVGPARGKNEIVIPEVSEPAIEGISLRDAYALREIAGDYWERTRMPHESDDAPNRDPEYGRECYLSLEALLDHWGARGKVGASKMSGGVGVGMIIIPEQGVEISGAEVEDRTETGDAIPVITFTPSESGLDRIEVALSVIGDSWRGGGLVRARVGAEKPVYYRFAVHPEAMSAGSAGRTLRQVIVIPCRAWDRRIVIAGVTRIQARKPVYTKLYKLMATLPAFPGAGGIECSPDPLAKQPQGRPLMDVMAEGARNDDEAWQ